jgi:EAL domain-containing protein (putative c-di-GMP-specific phosphodiesterase class I)
VPFFTPFFYTFHFVIYHISILLRKKHSEHIFVKSEFSLPFILMQWLIVRYAQQNMEQIIEAIRIAKQEGLSVSLDLASFEVCMHTTDLIARSKLTSVSCFFVIAYHADGP